MARIKSKSVLRIEFLDSTKEQIVLANYLRGKDAKGQILAASTTVLYPYALAEHDGVDLQDVDFAIESSIAEMEKQIKVMRQYQKIKLGHNSADKSLAQNQMSKKSVIEDQEDEDEEPVFLISTDDDLTLNF